MAETIREGMNMNQTLFMHLMLGWLLLALGVLPVLLFVRAPYGRYVKKGWGPLIPNHIGWIVMEIPSLIIFFSSFLSAKQWHDPKTWILFSLWGAHYIHRSVIFPFRIHTRGKKMPLLILIMAICFNGVNGFLNGYFLGHLRPVFPENHWLDGLYLLGLCLFISGFIINSWADNRLIHLRRKNGNEYDIPYGGLFTWVSCPNYFGEIMEWGGFALMAWNMPALSFFVWTIANLLPRALDHHKWYKNHFPEYPSGRKALFPGLL